MSLCWTSSGAVSTFHYPVVAVRWGGREVSGHKVSNKRHSRAGRRWGEGGQEIWWGGSRVGEWQVRWISAPLDPEPYVRPCKLTQDFPILPQNQGVPLQNGLIMLDWAMHNGPQNNSRKSWLIKYLSKSSNIFFSFSR